MVKTNRFWILLFALLFIASIAGAYFIFTSTGDTALVGIYVDGVCLRRIDLSAVDKPYSFTVEGTAGLNTILVEPGRICVSHADCPDQVCVQEGWLSGGILPIVCLPHRLVIQAENGMGAGSIDAVSS